MRSTGEDGYITLAVLVLAGVLATLVSTLLMVSRPSLGLTRTGGDEVAAEGLIDGGMNAAAYLLFAAEREAASVDGTVLRFRTGTVSLTVMDEAGRIDLNTADPELLSGLYSAVGGRSMPAQAFAGRVQDWRDEDSEVAEGGAEGEDYSAAGLAYGPPNQPFRRIAELSFLLGMSQQDFARLEPFITVFSMEGMIDPLSAPMPVLRAIPDLEPPDIAILMEARRTGITDREEILEAMELPSDYLRIDASGTFRIRVVARLTNGFSDGAEAVIMAPPDEKADYGVLAWSKLAPAARPR